MELYKKRNSKYWWYDFAVRGKRYRGSTKETNENRAAKIAALEFSDACKHRDPLPRKAPTLQETSNRFLQWVGKARLSDNTREYYEDGWRLLKATSILSLRLDVIDNEVAEQLRFPGSAATTNCALRTLRRLMHKAEEWKLIRRAPKIRLVPENARTLVLDDAAERKLINGARQCNWRKKSIDLFRDIVVLVRDTGMRNRRELYQIRVENINFEDGRISIPDSKFETCP